MSGCVEASTRMRKGGRKGAGHAGTTHPEGGRRIGDRAIRPTRLQLGQGDRSDLVCSARCALSALGLGLDYWRGSTPSFALGWSVVEAVVRWRAAMMVLAPTPAADAVDCLYVLFDPRYVRCGFNELFLIWFHHSIIFI